VNESLGGTGGAGGVATVGVTVGVWAGGDMVVVMDDLWVFTFV
jgi:hypothetical protein